MRLGEFGDVLGDGGEGCDCAAIGEGDAGELVVADGVGEVFALRDMAEQGEGGEAEEFFGGGGEAVVDLGGFTRVSLIDDELAVGGGVIVPEKLDEGVGIGE